MTTHDEFRSRGGTSWHFDPDLDDHIWLWHNLSGFGFFHGLDLSVLEIKACVIPTPCDLGSVLDIELGRRSIT